MLETDFKMAIKEFNLHKAEIFWQEVQTNYQQSSRHYHTIAHLDFLHKELSSLKNEFSSWMVTVFAIAYHDIIYKVLRSNNEEKSADLATDRLRAIQLPPSKIDLCRRMILATKKHDDNPDKEINLFTDADLAILGTNPEAYLRYTNQIRSEYSIYPDVVYKPGRKKVVQHFLEMPRIFKTDEFACRYEKQARTNLGNELLSLTRI